MNILQRFNLDGSVAVITGGGRGIGRAIALAYAEAGADVVCAARTLADVQGVADEVRALGRRALALTCDVNDGAQREALVAAAREQFGRITHLVNNAGGAGPNDPLTLTPERLEEILRFNVTRPTTSPNCACRTCARPAAATSSTSPPARRATPSASSAPTAPPRRR